MIVTYRHYSSRTPTNLDDIRRALIEDELKEPFDPEELPDHVPTIFGEAS
jgi:hypothetical protein